jgi:hypothetical protein
MLSHNYCEHLFGAKWNRIPRYVGDERTNEQEQRRFPESLLFYGVPNMARPMNKFQFFHFSLREASYSFPSLYFWCGHGIFLTPKFSYRRNRPPTTSFKVLMHQASMPSSLEVTQVRSCMSSCISNCPVSLNQTNPRYFPLSSGIGYVTARELVKAGAHVVIGSLPSQCATASLVILIPCSPLRSNHNRLPKFG